VLTDLNAETAGNCFEPFSPDTASFQWKAKPGPYKIAVCNSHFGNAWRAQMMRVADAFAKSDGVKADIKSFSAASAGQDVAAQIVLFNQMMLSGMDAIILDAASDAGLNQAVERAAKQGILVVSFDNVVTSKAALKVMLPQVEDHIRYTEWLVQKIGGKGTILLNRGVPGAPLEIQGFNAVFAVLKKYPKIKTIEVWGKWDDGTSQKVVADALASNPQIDGIISQGGDQGVVQAFLQAGRTIPPIAGECQSNGFRKLSAKHHVTFFSISNSPSSVAVAMKAAIATLKGEKLPAEIKLPMPTITDSDLQPDVNYFPELPDDTLAAVNIPVCNTNLDPKAILVGH
jgi:ribose transport system substrate-binding protein